MQINTEDYLEFKRDLSWEDVFASWERDEASQKDWENLWRKSGYTSWKQWRGKMNDKMDLANRKWSQYSITQPNICVPEFFVGSFPAWKRFYEARENSRFKDLLYNEELRNHSKIKGIMEAFPAKTMLVGFRYADGKIMIYEGTHRALAIALATQKASTIESEITIAITDFKDSDQYFDEMP